MDDTELPSRRSVALSAAAFVLLFLGSVVLLGDILGSFGDPDDVFVEHYASSTGRLKDIIGSVLLVPLGGLFVWHVSLVRRSFAMQRWAAVDWPLLASTGFAFALVIAAAAFATVPLVTEFGNLFDERHPRFEGAETVVLAQFGYVLVFGAGGMAAAAAILFTTWESRRSAPGWIAVAGYIASLLLPLSAAALMLFMALPLWVCLTALAVWMSQNRRAPDAT
jgi:hypothetical protein